MFRIFTPLFNEVDHVTTTFVTSVSSSVVAAIAPVVYAGLILSFLFYAVLIMRGVIHEPVMDYLWKVVRTAIIVNIAFGGGLYQTDLADLIRTVPDDLATSVMGSSAEETGQAALIDQAAQKGLDKAGEAFEKGSFFTQHGVAFYVFGILLLLGTVAMVAVGGATILMAKVVLAILAALGPMFIAALLFDSTRRFFERWMGMVVTYGLLIVLFACVFMFLLAIYGNYMTNVSLDGNMNVAYGIGGALILSIVTIFILLEMHHLAVGLGGGVTMHMWMGRRRVWSRKWIPSYPGRRERSGEEKA